MESGRKWIIVIAVILIADLISLLIPAFSGNAVNSANSPGNPLELSDVFSKALLNESVVVKGTVSQVLPEYKSKSGYNYQQFMITDGKESVKIFCSEKYGKSEAKEGDEIIFNGKFQKYYNQYEIYGFCSEIKIL